MNKRGITEHAIMTIIFGILVVLAIAVTWPIVSRVLFGARGELRTAEVNLDSLHQSIIFLLNQKDVYATKQTPLFIQENAYIIVGFNANDDKVQSGCYDETATRPLACPQGRACLCLYEDTNGQDFDDDAGGPAKPITCRTLPGNVLLLAPSNKFEDYEPDQNDETEKWNFGVKDGSPSILTINKADPAGLNYDYENLLLYGQCSSSMFGKGTVWNKQDVHIEKLTKEKTNYVYIARKARMTEQRRQTLEAAHPKV